MKKIQAFYINTKNKIQVFLKYLYEKIRSTHPVVQITAFSVCAAVFFLIFIASVAGPPVRRSVFLFKDANGGKIRTEIRYIPKTHGIDARLDLYVSELLLGPMNPGYIPLYNHGVHLTRCFSRGNAAYIDLSAEALLPGKAILPSDTAYTLFKKNVFTNFRNLDKIYMYIDGIEVYSENPYAGATEKNKKR